MYRLAPMLVIAVVILAGCGAVPAATTTPTSAPPTVTRAAPYASRGLGLSRADWEVLYGAPTREDPGVGFVFYGPRLTVSFND